MKLLRGGKEMSVFARIIVILVSLICFFIMWLEMFSWEKSGKKFFPEPEPGYFHKTVSMAANQGLYNGFLGAGMIWSAFMGNKGPAVSTAVFFLACMIIAGIYGAVTVTKGILIKQAAPAAVALAIVLLAG
jgi:putative membrane protein